MCIYRICLWWNGLISSSCNWFITWIYWLWYEKHNSRKAIFIILNNSATKIIDGEVYNNIYENKKIENHFDMKI